MLTIQFVCLKVKLLISIAQYFSTILFRHRITANRFCTVDIEGYRMGLWDVLILFYCDMGLNVVLD